MSEPRYLTEHDIDEIAEKAAERALEKVYAQVGQNILKKITWALGLAAIGLMMWLGGSGNLPK